MHIIFGSTAQEIPDSFTVLELDTFHMVKENRTDTAYCVVEKIPLTEFAMLESYKTIHADLIKYYKQRQWTYCENAIDGLMGRWNGELDTFYSDLLSRVISLKDTEPPKEWNGSLLRL